MLHKLFFSWAYYFTFICEKSSSIGVSLQSKFIFNLIYHFLSLISLINHSFPSKGHFVIIARSQTLNFVEKVSEFFSSIHFNCKSSSQETGTGTFQAHKNHVTFGVFLTIYQLSFVTTICTKIYHGKIFFFLFTFTQPALTETTS
jgi:hypothetical protein